MIVETRHALPLQLDLFPTPLRQASPPARRTSEGSREAKGASKNAPRFVAYQAFERPIRKFSGGPFYFFLKIWAARCIERFTGHR